MSSQFAPSKRHSLNIYTGPKPLHLVDGTAPDFQSRNLASTHRRQSSISYKRSSYDSPSHIRLLDESDSPHRGIKPRPKSVAYPSTPLSGIPRDRRSIGPGFSTAGLSVEDRPPLTLAEKHADLLRFIAQKESKCLELRSQFAVHEAELLQLKHKWERIVSRGFESPHSFSSPASSTTHSPPTTYTSTSSISPSTPDGAINTVIEGIKEGMQDVSRLLATSLSITNGDHAHSLSTNSADANTTTTTSTTATTTTIVRPRLRPTSTPLKSRERPHSLNFPLSHYPGSHIRSSNLSTSSSSTTTTTSGTRLSGTPLSSASSFFFEEAGPEKQQERGQGQEPTVENDEKGVELKTARQGDCDSDRGGSPHSSSSYSQELIVRDTGATPTVSPNPKFMFRLGRRRERERERERRKEPEVGDVNRVEVQLEGGSGGGGGSGWTENGSLDGVSILGGLGIDSDRRGYADAEGPAASSSAIDAGSTRCHRRKSREASLLRVEGMHSQDESLVALGSQSPRSLSPNSSDPASFEGGHSVPVASRNESGSGTYQTQSPSTSSSWTSRGWGSATITKSQKRASLLFSDVSHTLVSAFSSMAGTCPTARPPPSPAPVSLTMHDPPTSASASVSLLDQDEEEGGFFSTRAALQPMKPIVVGSTLGPGQSPNPNVSRTEEEDMDWGW
ncbi:hypothetical protein APHAL10511_008051 [Amanita phalloides]|nr:hypothetical protein APHAL10511_008051 [Amanita phalloides]